MSDDQLTRRNEMLQALGFPLDALTPDHTVAIVPILGTPARWIGRPWDDSILTQQELNHIPIMDWHVIVQGFNVPFMVRGWRTVSHVSDDGGLGWRAEYSRDRNDG